ncbi:Na+/H+ antiporter subunit E [Niallia sp. Krafla_26]|uniref:Na+/H+ antiporter subunit E n=1 Tax=Niallia sp. Krafla_26 TaxID=3064703 RepID=UPI003D171F4F
MAFQILLNLVLAFLWMFMKNSYEPINFFMGYVIGLIMLFIFRRFFSTRFYLGRVFAILHLLLVFIKEVILSNLAVLKIVLKPKLDMKPGIFALPLDVKKGWEIYILSCLITLTPGTLVMKVSNDRKLLYIHAMDVPDVKDSIGSIKNGFERLIKEVSR